jgi:hypothetical protein
MGLHASIRHQDSRGASRRPVFSLGRARRAKCQQGGNQGGDQVSPGRGRLDPGSSARATRGSAGGQGQPGRRSGGELQPLPEPRQEPPGLPVQAPGDDPGREPPSQAQDPHAPHGSLPSRPEEAKKAPQREEELETVAGRLGLMGCQPKIISGTLPTSMSTTISLRIRVSWFTTSITKGIPL